MAACITALLVSRVDWVHHTVTFPSDMPEQQRQDLTNTFFSQPPQKGMNRAFEVRAGWEHWSTSTGAPIHRIILIQAPRSPAPRPAPPGHLTWTAVDQLCKRPWVSVIDRHAFEDLEKPELFADHVHLNAEGRQWFSPRLAEAIQNCAGR